MAETDLPESRVNTTLLAENTRLSRRVDELLRANNETEEKRRVLATKLRVQCKIETELRLLVEKQENTIRWWEDRCARLKDFCGAVEQDVATTIRIPATDRMFAFGVAYHTILPSDMGCVEVRVHENGKSIDLTPWNKDEMTVCVLQMDKQTATAVGKALLEIATGLPEVPTEKEI